MSGPQSKMLVKFRLIHQRMVHAETLHLFALPFALTGHAGCTVVGTV